MKDNLTIFGGCQWAESITEHCKIYPRVSTHRLWCFGYCW